MTLPPDDPRHGTANGYRNHGCRCDDCRTANTAYMRENRYGPYRVSLCSCGAEKTILSATCRACRNASIAAEHGTESMYKNGCRCEKCRAATNAARARRRRTPNPRVHGSRVSYGNGCRCGECREAHRVYSRERKARLRAAA